MSITPALPTKERQEAGMVAILVTLILMIVISLIVLGFAQISRRNQRAALDRQLSTQAFYAAETGVNDAAELIKNALASGAPVPNKTTCDSSGFPGLSPDIDTASEVAYTCLLINPSPLDLAFKNVDDTGKVVPIIAASGTIRRITLTWKSQDGSPNPEATCPNNTGLVFSNTDVWTCGYGVFHFDIVPTAGGGNTIASLQSNNMSTHVVPLRPGGAGGVASVNYLAGGGANNKVGVLCNSTRCTININFASPQSQYYMRFNSFYKPVDLTITAINPAGAPVALTGAQALVDVTGKAQDVFRRLQVRLPLAGSSINKLSDYAIASSEPICKRFWVMDGLFDSKADTDLTAAGYPSMAAVTDNPICN